MDERGRRFVGGLVASETAGAVGLQVTAFLVPLAAVQLFNAGPLAIGALNLVDSIAALVVGVAVGHWIDSVGGVRAMATANVVRCAVLALLGLAFALGPQLWILYLAMFCTGVASLVHEAGLTSAVLYLGETSSHGLNRVNALLRASSVVAELAGPGIGGIIVAALGFAAGAGVGSFGFGVATIAAVLCLRHVQIACRSAPPPSNARPPRPTLQWSGGMRFIWGDPTLRRLSVSSLHFNLFSAIFQAVFLVYCVRELGLDTAGVAAVAVIAGIGALGGAMLAASRAVADAQKSFYVSSLAVPAVCVGLVTLAGLVGGVVPLTLVAGAQALFSACMVVCIVLFNTIRQLKSPAHMAGQIAASERVLALVGEIPGAVIGGVLGSVFSLAVPLVVAAVGMLCAGMWLVAVPDWSHEIPADEEPAHIAG